MTTDDLAADCTGLDGAESISVTFRRPDGDSTLVVPSALRRALARGVNAIGGVSIAGDEVVWNVPQAALGDGRDLQPGDTITAGAEAWSIVAARLETLGCRWRCVSRRLP